MSLPPVVVDERRSEPPVGRFPVVGLGASAGGLEAFEAFFRACPADTGAAFVVVMHLAPDHESLLTEILQRCTVMPVMRAVDHATVAADHIYVIPPNREMAISKGKLQLSLPDKAHGQRMPIDTFLRSLADDQQEQAIGIILSGSATDGTLGLRAIHGAGGICMVQDPATAKYDEMPQSAIAAGYATYVLPVPDMPARLLETMKRKGAGVLRPAGLPPEPLGGLKQILLHLRVSTGQDFSSYKESTVSRRIERRMALHRIDDLTVYARLLRENPDETQKLFRELLINVTSFFRDPHTFIDLKDIALRPMLASKAVGSVFRVWVAGCSSGEEAYSIAIVLTELFDEITAKHELPPSVQIYATDLDDEAINIARSGHYPLNIAQDITPERLQRFFLEDGAGYKVSKALRDMVVFAVQSVTRDPPFTRLDLLSCRNVMIYLEPELQRRLISTFHYALKPRGVLFLSTSENIAGEPRLFSTLDRKSKLYRVVESGVTPRTVIAPVSPWVFSNSPNLPKEAVKKTVAVNFDELTRRTLLQSYAPASVVTDRKGNIHYVYGDTGAFLRPAPGHATLNVIDMAREGLQRELRSLYADGVHLAAAPRLNREVSVRTDAGYSVVSYSVRPLAAPQPTNTTDADTDQNLLLLLSFETLVESRKLTKKAAEKVGSGSDRRPAQGAPAMRIAHLEQELAWARANQQASIEEQQAYQEESQSTNEELQSTNEELQSTNEELETSKEELQSINEEMVTVNAELNAKIEQLSDIQNDLKNLLDSISIGTLFVDHSLVIRRYTTEALKIFRLVAADIGRPLADIKSNLATVDLLHDLQTVLDTLTPIAREVQTTSGEWYLARLGPYRTLDNVIAGAVMTFTDITKIKLVSEAAKRSEAQLATAQELAQLGSWEVDTATGLMRGSAQLFNIFGMPPVVATLPLTDLLSAFGQQDRERIVVAQLNALMTRTAYDIEARLTRPDGTIRDVRSRGVPVTDASDRVTQLVGTTLDITDVREIERVKASVMQLARELAEGIVNTITEPLIVLDQDLRVISASRAFYAYFRVADDVTVGRKIYDLGDGQWNILALRQLLENVLPKDQSFEGYVVEHDFPELGQRKMRLNARRIVPAVGNTELILLAIVTDTPTGARIEPP